MACSSSSTWSCNMCPMDFNCRNKKIIHVLRDHRDEDRFSVFCSFAGCNYSTTVWSAFRKHCTRVHFVKVSDLMANQNPRFGGSAEVDHLQEIPDNDQGELLQVSMPLNKPNSTTMVGKFLLNLETRHHLTRKGLDSLTGCFDDIFQQISLQVQESIQKNLGLPDDHAVFSEIKETCSSNIHELLNESARHKMYRSSFSFLPPEPILHEDSTKTLGHFVPLVKLLNLLFQQDQIWNLVSKRTRHNRPVMSDFVDGKYMQNHQMIKEQFFLQLALYYDDLELQNPLRSNKRHKLGMFYVSILNFPVEYRSQLQNIFAVVVARVFQIKRYGFQTILRDFLETVKKLQTTGIVITRGEEQHVFHGDLIAVMCDTPAAAALGGFKGSSAFANHFCRTCMATQKSFHECLTPHDFQLRDMQTYLTQCATIENPRLVKRKAFWSKLYGLNERSCLCSIPDFPVTKCLLQDPMHILLEGCLPYVLALFLDSKIFQERLFTLDDLNQFICKPSLFKQDRKDVAVPIEPKHIRTDKIVKQKASISLVMAYNLPVFLAEYFKFEDAQYNNLLSLIRITILSFRPKCDMTTAGILQQEITNFLETFRRCYPQAKVKPKMHFLLHLPQQMVEFGPLRNHSTMRAEAKHQSFKDNRWRNFINLPHSLLKRHQLCLANQLTDAGGNFVVDFLQDNNIAKGRVLPVSELEMQMVDSIAQANCLEIDVDCVMESVLLKWHGRWYEKGDCLLLSECELKGPSFGVLDKMYTPSDGKFLEVFATARLLKTLDFVPAMNAYRVKATDETKCVLLSKLHVSWCVPLYSVKGELYIVNRYGIIS